MTTADRHEAFAAMHVKGAAFVIPNPWDIGSAKVLAALGAKALATTSSGHAFTLGRPDGGHVTRDEALAHAQDIVVATGLPVTGDFENGYGDAPDDVAETVRLAAEAGLSGISVEDTTMPEIGAYDFDLAVERVRAGVAAARALGRPFVFCARADGWLNRTYDAAEALRRIAAFDAVGPDLLYAPGLKEPDQAAMIKATETPVNVLVAGRNAPIPRARWVEMGAARLSVGGALARRTQKVLIDAARAMLDDGNFGALAPIGEDVDKLLAEGTS
ncbi:MAG: isocitrate lyase/phosphoenolpyruvate mutase family protein [Pseudomonadota bacterium]